MQQDIIDSVVFSKMQVNEPYASYKKTTVGKVHVMVINPWSNKPEGRILKGDPRKLEDDMIVDTWSEQQDTYFTRMNRQLFNIGAIIKFNRPTTVPERSPNEMTDAEVAEAVNFQYLKLTSLLNKITAEATVKRLLDTAEAEGKSAKMQKAIEARLAEIQRAEFGE